MDYAKHDYRFRPGSPAIDAGFDGGGAAAFDGVPVPSLAGRDIGAFEFTGK